MLSPRHCGEIFVEAKRLSQREDGEVCRLAKWVLELLEEVGSFEQETRESWRDSYHLSILISSINGMMSIEGIVGLLQESVRDGRIRRLLQGEPEAEEIHTDEKRRGLVFLDGSDIYVPADFEDNGACAVIIRARKRAYTLKRENNQVESVTQ